jgi:ATP-binding cassette subfamily E protein 1
MQSYSFIRNAKKTAFIVEHDFMMATYLADRVIVFEGEPSLKTIATEPQSILSGMNTFLKSLKITFRRFAIFMPYIHYTVFFTTYIICN